MTVQLVALGLVRGLAQATGPTLGVVEENEGMLSIKDLIYKSVNKFGKGFKWR
jgi:hypothetical protein